MGADRIKKRAKRSMPMEQHAKGLLLVSVVVVLVILLYPNLVIQPHQYQLGDIAERDIKAHQDFFVEDEVATEANRQQAVQQVRTVYDYDPRIHIQIADKVTRAFEEMGKILADFNDQPAVVPPVDLNSTPPEAAAGQLPEKALWDKKESFESAIGIDISRGAYSILVQENFSTGIAQQITKILNDIHTNGVVANKEILVKEVDNGITLRDVASQTEKTVPAVRQYYGPDQAKTMVRVVAQPLVKDLNYNLVNLIVDFCQRLVQPNITLNRNETEKRKAEALANIKPIMYKFKAGEMLLREGERVTEEKQLILNALKPKEENRKIIANGFGAAIIIGLLLYVMHALYFRHPRYAALNTGKNLLFMSVVLVVVFAIVKISLFLSPVLAPSIPFPIPAAAMVYAAPTAAGAMLICIFLGFDIALPFSLVSAICAALLFGNQVEIFVFFLISNTMAAYWVQHCRERKVFFIAGFKLGLLNMLLATVIGVYTSDYEGLKLLSSWPIAFFGGISSAIVTVGVAPLLEITFRYTTDITLLELANLDRPILKRLMLEAPGTYHHSVIVGSLVEAAAAEIGANPLLAKVCGYYHDIGKVKKPLYFIENQGGGKNKHDKLAPSMSSLILIAHIKDGIEIARQNKLGQVIVDTIQQHHGTSLIHYFFEKARQLKGADAVNIDDFRYPGPRPQTKEAGLVMLADVVEAASRTLENPTPSRIQGLVQNLVNKIFSDGQLDHCELTLRDLHNIAKSFNKILNGIHHHRIEYTESATREDGREYGNLDRQPAGKPSDRSQDRSKESAGHLKRLGLP